jgi:RNA polymerase sigma-70 factor (ECF subfamily)
MAPRPIDRTHIQPESPQSDGLLAFDPECAFEHLYETYAASIERWVRRLAGPTADVEDLLHDVFVVAIRRRSEFRGEARLSTWLFRITENVVRKRRFRVRLRGLLNFRHHADLEITTTPSPTPLEEIERRQEHAQLYAALDRLPEKYRTPVILCDIEGLSAIDAGQLLDLSPNVIWVRVHRARAMLLELLMLVPRKKVVR